MEINDGLYVKLGFHADTTKLKDFIRAIGDLNMKSVMSAVGLGGLYAATQKIADIANEASMKLYNFHQQTGMDTTELQQFSRFAEQMGAGKDAAEAYVRSLQDLKESYRTAQPGATFAIQMTGLDPNKLDDFKYVQKTLREFYNGAAPDIDKLRVAQELHGVALLGAYKASEDLWKSQYKLDVISDKERDSIALQNSAWHKMGQEWVVVATRIQVMLVPAVIALAKSLEWVLNIVAGKDFIGGFLRWTAVLLGVGMAIQGIIKSIQLLLGLKAALMGIGAAAGAGGVTAAGGAATAGGAGLLSFIPEILLAIGAIVGFKKLLDWSPAMQKYNQENGLVPVSAGSSSGGESRIYHNDIDYNVNVAGGSDSHETGKNLTDALRYRHWGDSGAPGF